MLKVLFFLVQCSCVIFNIKYVTAIKGDNVRYAKENEFPFLVTINLKSENEALPIEALVICTGTLITKRHALTAEHGLIDRSAHDMEVIAGSVDLEKGRRYDLESWISYDLWKKKKERTTLHDVAIITLHETVRNVKPARVLLTVPITRSGSNLTIAGWGDSADRGPTKLLKTANLEFLSRDECRTKFRDLNIEFPFLQQDMCTVADPWVLLDCGDSGGPLLNEKNMVVGINVATCPQFRPDGITRPVWNSKRVNMHTSIYYYKTFIRHITGMRC